MILTVDVYIVSKLGRVVEQNLIGNRIYILICIYKMTNLGVKEEKKKFIGAINLARVYFS